MRAVYPLVLLLLTGLSGCAGYGVEAFGAMEASSVAVFGRGVADLGVSAITGKDCSIVRLDKGQNYCAPRERMPEAPQFCTATLGNVQCWANPEAFVVLPHQLADAPALNAEQVKNVNARWPKSLNIGD
jgi:hypothetical protein